MAVQVTGDGGVTKEIVKAGTGAKPTRGQKVAVHYVGTFPDGKKFDSSRDRKKPFEFQIGSGVITGWSLGVATMQVGEVSKFTIKSDYAYGDKGHPAGIPPKATLLFEIELLKIL